MTKQPIKSKGGLAEVHTDSYYHSRGLGRWTSKPDGTDGLWGGDWSSVEYRTERWEQRALSQLC